MVDLLCEQVLVPGGHSRTAWTVAAIQTDRDGKLRKCCHQESELCNLQFLALRRLRMCCDPPQNFADISRDLQGQGCLLTARQVQTFWEARNTRRVLFQFINEHLFRPPTLTTYLFRDPEAKLRNCHLRNREEINAQFLAIEKLVYRRNFETIYQILARECYQYHTYGNQRREEIKTNMQSFWQERCIPLIQAICDENNYPRPEEL